MKEYKLKAISFHFVYVWTNHRHVQARPIPDLINQTVAELQSVGPAFEFSDTCQQLLDGLSWNLAQSANLSHARTHTHLSCPM